MTVLATAVLLSATTKTPAQPLAERIAAVTGRPEFKHAHWGILIADLKTGETIYELEPEKLCAPASTTKLFTVASAFDNLGADFHFETPVYARGTIDGEGTLSGDLVLVASGDTTLGGRTDAQGHIEFTNSDHTYAQFSAVNDWTPTDPLAGLNELARQVLASGIKRVTGDVIVDDRLFDHSESSGSGPTIVTPIMVNDNVIDLRISPAAANEAAKVEIRPECSSIRQDCQVQTVANGAETKIDVSEPSAGFITVRGQIAADHKPLIRTVPVPDPTNYARSLFVEALQRAKVATTASPLETNHAENLPAATEYASLKRVALLTSPRFAEAAKLILKVSHNLHASTLPLIVASRHQERTLEAGLKRQAEFLKKAGVDVESISFGGGAGGARADFVTPRATVQLLRYMATRPDFADYRGALPVFGVDGTVATAIEASSPAKGKVQAKTGTLLWENLMNGTELVTSKALAGYAQCEGGREVAFAVFLNNVQIKQSAETAGLGKALAKICEEIVKKP